MWTQGSKYLLVNHRPSRDVTRRFEKRGWKGRKRTGCSPETRVLALQTGLPWRLFPVSVLPINNQTLLQGYCFGRLLKSLKQNIRNVEHIRLVSKRVRVLTFVYTCIYGLPASHQQGSVSGRWSQHRRPLRVRGIMKWTKAHLTVIERSLNRSHLQDVF